MRKLEIDRKVLANLYGENKESIASVLATFLEGYSVIRESLLSGLYSGKIEKIKKALHSHGPSFMYIGLPEVSGLFKEAQNKCRTTDTAAGLSGFITDLLAILEEVRLLVLSELKSLEAFA